LSSTRVHKLDSFRFDQLLLTIQLLGAGARPQQRKFAPFSFELTHQLGYPLLLFKVAKARHHITLSNMGTFTNQHLDDDTFRLGTHDHFAPSEYFEFRRNFQFPTAYNGDYDHRTDYSEISILPESSTCDDGPETGNGFECGPSQCESREHRETNQPGKRESRSGPCIECRVHVD